MQIKFLFSAVFAALVLFVSSAASAMTIEVGYPYSALFDVTIKENIVPFPAHWTGRRFTRSSPT
jgi:hypothetical protein